MKQQKFQRKALENPKLQGADSADGPDGGKLKPVSSMNNLLDAGNPNRNPQPLAVIPNHKRYPYPLTPDRNPTSNEDIN